MAPRARGRGRACAIRRSSGNVGDRDQGAGQGADRDQAAGRDGGELLALHLPDEQALAGGGDDGDDQRADQAGQDAGRDGTVAARIVAQLAPAGRPRAVERGREHGAAERRDQRERPVQPEREQEHLSRRAAGRLESIDDSGAEDPRQRRGGDRAPQGRKLHPYAVSTGGPA